jgi:hypothetical protein
MSNPRNYLAVSALVFALVALAHLLRAVNSWPLVFGEWPVPAALSWGAAIVTATLCAWSLSLLRGRT